MKTLLVGRKEKHEVSLRHLASGFLEGLGVGWLCIEPTTYFVTAFDSFVKEYKLPIFSVIVAVSLGWGLWKSVRKLSTKAQIEGTDIDIEVVVGSLFAFSPQSAIVVSSNTTFDTCTDDDFISRSSMQGQVCERYFKGSWRDMDATVSKSIERFKPAARLDDGRTFKKDVYPVGTTAHLKVDSRHFYMVALATMNAQGRSGASFIDLQNTLVGLWQFVSHDGEQMDITIPLIGTGKARVPAKRSEVAEAIMRSFIAACKEGEKRFCNHLRIIINPEDYRGGHVDLEEVGENLRVFCRTSGRTSTLSPAALSEQGGHQQLPSGQNEPAQSTELTRSEFTKTPLLVGNPEIPQNHEGSSQI